jgi:hypothetical protein
MALRAHPEAQVRELDGELCYRRIRRAIPYAGNDLVGGTRLEVVGIDWLPILFNVDIRVVPRNGNPLRHQVVLVIN